MKPNQLLCSTRLANTQPCLPPQARNISNMKTLPRKMLPANLTGLKTALYKLLFSNMQPATASASAGALPAGTQQSEQLANSVNAATAVLERPTATTAPAGSTVLDRPAAPEVQAPKRRASEYHRPPVSHPLLELGYCHCNASSVSALMHPYIVWPSMYAQQAACIRHASQHLYT